MNNTLLINYTTLLILYRILYITFTFHVSSFNNTFSQKKKKKSSNNTYIHSRAKSTTRQHCNIIIIINILYKSYKQKGKKITATSYI